MQIVGNQVLGTVAGGRNAAYYSAGSSPDDQISCMDVGGVGTGPLVRVQPGQTNLTGYNFRQDGTNLVIRRYLPDNSGTVIDSVAGSVTPGDELCIKAEGSTITAYIEGVAVPELSVVDTSLTGGYPGIYSYNSTVYGDNWSGGGLGAGSLEDGQTYNYYVRCIDTIGNQNTNDYLISFTVGESAVKTLGNFTIQGVIQ
jgi:hypothetical protein